MTRKIIFAAVFLIMVILVSTLSHQDEIESERVYIENVCAGAWPDYRELRPDCK